jgi:hypothetical protein
MFCVQVGFEELEELVLSSPDPVAAVGSGQQELAEIIFDMHMK